MSSQIDAPTGISELEARPAPAPAWSAGDTDPTSFVELVLTATLYSEDEGEVRDLVDSLFDIERPQLADLREDRVA